MTPAKLLRMASLLLIPAFGIQAQAPVNSESNDVTFAVFNEQNNLENKRLTEFENQVVVLFYFTPW